MLPWAGVLGKVPGRGSSQAQPLAFPPSIRPPAAGSSPVLPAPRPHPDTDFSPPRSLQVRVVQHKQTKQLLALKYINKAKCCKMKAVANIIQERRLLEEVRRPLRFCTAGALPGGRTGRLLARRMREQGADVERMAS